MTLIETVAHIDDDHIREGMRAIRAGLIDGITEEERAIRLAAMELPELALQRWGKRFARAQVVTGVSSLVTEAEMRALAPS